MNLGRHLLSINRLEAFSDGVFAIAITLLILEVKIPAHEEVLKAGGLFNFLKSIWPNFFAYVFSFVVIGIYWANHHYFISMFKKTDHIFNMLTVLFLMCIAFLPYPTALLGDFISNEGERSQVISFYALGIWLPAIFWIITWQYGRKNLIDKNIAPEFLAKLNKLFILSNFLYALAFLISFISPIASLGINVILTLLYLAPPMKIEYIRNE
jgi:uncharacterized membrane protein